MGYKRATVALDSEIKIRIEIGYRDQLQAIADAEKRALSNLCRKIIEDFVDSKRQDSGQVLESKLQKPKNCSNRK